MSSSRKESNSPPAPHPPGPTTQVSELTVLTITSTHCSGSPSRIEIADQVPSSPYLSDSFRQQNSKRLIHSTVPPLNKRGRQTPPPRDKLTNSQKVEHSTPSPSPPPQTWHPRPQHRADISRASMPRQGDFSAGTPNPWSGITDAHFTVWYSEVK